MISILRLEQTVVAVLTAIYYADGIRIGIEIYQEVVSEHLHLEDSIFGCHRTESKRLPSDDLIVSLYLIIKICLLFEVGYDLRIVLLLLKKLGLLTTDLRFELINSLVYCSKDFLITGLGSQDLVIQLQCYLYSHKVTLGSDAHIEAAFVSEILVELAHLADDLAFKSLADLNPVSLCGDLHKITSFRNKLLRRRSPLLAVTTVLL